jgi:hypothetical protein
MSVKKEYVAFRAEGWQDLYNDNPGRQVTLYLGKHHETFSVEEARDVIDEIKKAIKQSKKDKNTPFF